MLSRVLSSLALGLIVLSANAQDASALLRKAAAAMGADDLRTLRFTGSGSGGQFGQAYHPAKGWPKVNYSAYERQADYAAGATIEIVTRSRAEPTGGGALPLQGEVRSGGAVAGQYAWNVAGPMLAPTPRQGARESRLHDLWITPHGAIMAAQRNNATLKFAAEGGREIAAVSFREPGVMSATLYISDGFILERVESRMHDTVLGDTPVVTTYSDYRAFGPVWFPMRIRQTIAGSPALDLAVKEVQPNARVDIGVPENVRTAAERVAAEKVADGVWYLTGGSHHSVAIEMKDHVILVESPLWDGRAAAVFAEVKKLVPGKPVRYTVSSHIHFDHAGGLRGAVAEGSAIVAQQGAKAYYEKAFANPNRIAPDLLAKSGRKAKVIGVADKHVLSDGARTVEIHKLRDPLHTDTFLMVWLPKEKLLIEADAYTPAPPGTPAPAKPNPYHVNLVDNIARLKLDVQRILPLHGRMVPASELYTAAGKTP